MNQFGYLNRKKMRMKTMINFLISCLFSIIISLLLQFFIHYAEDSDMLFFFFTDTFLVLLVISALVTALKIFIETIRSKNVDVKSKNEEDKNNDDGYA